MFRLYAFSRGKAVDQICAGYQSEVPSWLGGACRSELHCSYLHKRLLGLTTKSLFQSCFPVCKLVLNILSLGGWSCCRCKHMFSVFWFLGLNLVLSSGTLLFLS